MAVAGYMREDGVARVVVPLQVDGAWLLDLRDPIACCAVGIDPEWSRASWRQALSAGAAPASWAIADAARAAGADGLVDPSRSIPGGWHVNLFHWNIPSAPQIQIVGAPETVVLSMDGPKWGL
ncbi:hypothetical protein BVG79_02102 [Ketogulonicigenium robustum]|uniref:RES domain-containing protein n=2 Tax=Ketogulonicigenium robustum TaxID=92947 RepID=A0A1W6P1Q4_9RHOB|nr:hypothetical protein BVG79_02102 [Ketogulonicigenium robustum]